MDEPVRVQSLDDRGIEAADRFKSGAGQSFSFVSTSVPSKIALNYRQISAITPSLVSMAYFALAPSLPTP